MPRKLLIEIQGNKPLSAYGDNHIIAYDSTNKNYYVTTAESFFASQNNRIIEIERKNEQLIEKINEMQENMQKFENAITTRVDNFKSGIDRKFDNFLQTYQQSNAKVLELVETLVGTREE